MKLAQLYIPGVLLLIFFLSFSSQLLFVYIEPGPLEWRDAITFNSLIACLLVCYARACYTDTGKVVSTWQPQDMDQQRWCRKCEAFKPPRAHHCRECARCVTRMDHHCPWTVNCVSHRTFPHFFRFLFYCVLALARNEYLIGLRLAHIWQHRSWPAYLGPSHVQLIHLFVLIIVNSLTLFALTLLLGRTSWGLAVNITTIEGWEIERHHSLLRRARAKGGYVTGANGIQVRVKRVEFPYDIGVWKNIAQGLGTGNPLSWFWPFAATPALELGLSYETNDFNEDGLTWPPPDPDRVPMPKREPMEYQKQNVPDWSRKEEMDAFRARQAEDIQRWNTSAEGLRNRQHFRATTERLMELHSSDEESESPLEEETAHVPEVSATGFTPGILWRNSEGERLKDFGVDETVDYYDTGVQRDDDDVPLAALIARRQGNHQTHTTRGKSYSRSPSNSPQPHIT